MVVCSAADSPFEGFGLCPTRYANPTSPAMQTIEIMHRATTVRRTVGIRCKRARLRLNRIPTSGSTEPGHGALADATPKRRTSTAYCPRKAAPCLPERSARSGYPIYGQSQDPGITLRSDGSPEQRDCSDIVRGELALRPERRPKPVSRRKRLRRGRGSGAEANSVRLRGQRVEGIGRSPTATSRPQRLCPTAIQSTPRS
jgi:hypothetical protein